MGCLCVLTCSVCVWLFATPQAAACQAPLSMRLSMQESWSGLPSPPPSRGSSQPRDGTHVSYVCCTGRNVLDHKHHLGSPSRWDYRRITMNTTGTHKNSTGALSKRNRGLLQWLRIHLSRQGTRVWLLVQEDSPRHAAFKLDCYSN